MTAGSASAIDEKSTQEQTPPAPRVDRGHKRMIPCWKSATTQSSALQRNRGQELGGSLSEDAQVNEKPRQQKDPQLTLHPQQSVSLRQDEAVRQEAINRQSADKSARIETENRLSQLFTGQQPAPIIKPQQENAGPCRDRWASQ